MTDDQLILIVIN